MGYGYTPRLRWMLKLKVIAFLINFVTSVGLEPLYDLTAFHGVYYT
jgi:hypothetical protein